MPRTKQQIAADIHAAVDVIVNSGLEAAAAATGQPVNRDANFSPKITVRLDDGREVELKALADELAAATE